MDKESFERLKQAYADGGWDSVERVVDELIQEAYETGYAEGEENGGQEEEEEEDPS